MTDQSESEHVLWEGRPRQGFFLRGTEMFLLPFALLLNCAGVLIFVGAVRGQHPIICLVASVFVAAGAYCCIGRFIVDVIERRNTRYVVTSSSVVISRAAPLPGVRRIALADIPTVTDYEYRNGRGTLVFGD